MINKFCHYCKIKSKVPQRFKFTVKKNINFNYKIIINIVYLDRKLVFHTVDTTTNFQAGRFLNNISAKDTWEARCQCWIDTYLGPLDIITHNADTNFDSIDFCTEVKMVGITCYQILIEAYWLIGKIEKYHTTIRCAYDII